LNLIKEILIKDIEELKDQKENLKQENINYANVLTNYKTNDSDININSCEEKKITNIIDKYNFKINELLNKKSKLKNFLNQFSIKEKRKVTDSTVIKPLIEQPKLFDAFASIINKRLDNDELSINGYNIDNQNALNSSFDISCIYENIYNN
jgi:hypothetical protein